MSGSTFVDIELKLERFELAARFESDSEAFGVFGRSGAGKSSLLEAMIGLRRGVRGAIRVHGRTWLDTARGIDLPADKRRVGYVPQGALLFPHLTAEQNILAGARATRGAPIVSRCLEVLELKPLLDQSATTLSGGERARVAIARALCSMPDVLVLDEPLSSLDAGLRSRVLPYLRRVREEFDVPLIVVSHSPTELQTLADQLFALDEGAIVDSGAPSEVFARALIAGRVVDEPLRNVLRVESIALNGKRVSAKLEGSEVVLIAKDAPLSMKKGSAMIPADSILLVRNAPEAVSASNLLPGQVVGVDRGEGRAVVHLRLDGSNVVVLVEILEETIARLGIESGASFHALFKASACELV